MIVHFSKYHGTGNDFVMIDGRNQETACLGPEIIRQICDRRFGVGGDGLIILNSDKEVDFKMRYFNCDGFEGSMCGNGGRCITAFAEKLGIISMEAAFKGIDGMHLASILPNGEVRLKLKDVSGISWAGDGYILDTGSPHFVKFVSQLDEIDLAVEGAGIRNQPRFGKSGVNVNFVEPGGSSNRISVRTFERGVEAETYSCGTGVAAAAIASYYHFRTDILSYHIHTRGGDLNVSFKVQHHNSFADIFLTGPVTHVFDGSIEICP